MLPHRRVRWEDVQCRRNAPKHAGKPWPRVIPPSPGPVEAATAGFETVGRATGIPSKSLIRLFGSRGNPQAKHLFVAIGHLVSRADRRLHVVMRP
jgi:hypothetical protein